MPVVVALLVVLLIVAIIRRAFRVAIVAVILAFLIPACTAIMCGEGEGYIDRFSSLFTPTIEQTIKDGYQDFAEKEKENPILDKGQVDSALEDLWNAAKDKVTGIARPSPDEMEGHNIPYHINP